MNQVPKDGLSSGVIILSETTLSISIQIRNGPGSYGRMSATGVRVGVTVLSKEPRILNISSWAKANYEPDTIKIEPWTVQMGHVRTSNTNSISTTDN